MMMLKFDPLRFIADHAGMALAEAIAEAYKQGQQDAQPEPKKGRWITKSTNGEMFDCCSVCGYVEWDEPKNFCPNCGADMRGGQDG